MHVLSPDEALLMLLADDADEQAGAPQNDDREIVIVLSDQDLLTIELSLRDVVANMDRREFTDHMQLSVHEALRWADELHLLQQSVFGERKVQRQPSREEGSSIGTARARSKRRARSHVHDRGVPTEPPVVDRLRRSFAWRGDRTDTVSRADVTRWWRDAESLDELGPGLAPLFSDAAPTVITGTESRGSLLGVLTAQHLHIGFAEVRENLE
jgi:hypothetical protein